MPDCYRAVLLKISIWFLILGVPLAAQAQDEAAVNWRLTSDAEPTAASGDVVGTALVGSNMTVYDYGGTSGDYEGPFGSYQRWWIREGENWPDESVRDETRYVEATVRPELGVRFVADSLTLYLSGEFTSDMRADIFVATDSTFDDATALAEDLALPNGVPAEDARFAFALDETVESGEVLYVRIYSWIPGGTDNPWKYTLLQDMTISGTTEVVPVPAAATWPLDIDAMTMPRTEGTVEAQEQSITDQYVIRDYGGSDGSQRVHAPGGPGNGLGYWPEETERNPDRYTEFRMGPRDGVTFEPDSVSLYLGNSGGSDDLRASISYSTDGFATETELASALELPNASLARYAYALPAAVLEGGDQVALRVYPWLQGGRDSGKYFNIKNVVVSGTATGTVAAELPTVSTAEVTSISTTSATTGGVVTSDGGAPVIARGVVYSTATEPTLDDAKTIDGEGVGVFTSMLTALERGTTYYARAYATNSSGTAYGEERSFATLAELTPPDVVTVDVEDIRPDRATVEGFVGFDGGLEVTERGIVWNATGEPTLEDASNSAGGGLGAFTAAAVGLEAETTYYVRTYAINAEGTAYGNEKTFTTVAPAPPLTIVVDQDGGGDYMTVQEAFDAVPENYTGPITIQVMDGVYDEKMILTEDKINVTLVGESRDGTILTHDDYSGKVVDGETLGTFTSYSVAIDADDFVARDITFQNTSDVAQAVALRVTGDRVEFYNVTMLGYQDTYYTQGYGRIYHKDCYIEGTTDFIFGRSVAVFDECTIHSKRNSTITAARTEQGYKFGYVFRNNTLTADEGLDDVGLGRPWREYAQVVFMNSEMGDHIAPEGWMEWSGTDRHETAYYAEYENTGPGYQPDQRVEWAHILSDEEAAAYTLENIFAKDVAPTYSMDWMPSVRTVEVEDGGTGAVPARYELRQNYPNPFSGATAIAYELAAPSHVELALYDVLGRRVQLLVDRTEPAGSHEVAVEGGDLPSGVYFYMLRAGDFSETRKMLLVR